jgi:hypothetical protein
MFLEFGCCSVHLRQEERLVLRVGRDGGLQNFELHGLVTLRISDEKLGCIRVQLENKDARGIQLQVNVCKSVPLFFFYLYHELHAFQRQKQVVHEMIITYLLQYRILLLFSRQG